MFWARRSQSDSCILADAAFGTTVEVEAHVVMIKNAALPKQEGILSPLLEKQLEGFVAASSRAQ